MMDTTDAALNQAPEALNGVRVYVSHDVDSAGMMDAMMQVPCASYSAVTQEFVGEDGALGHHVLFDRGQERCRRRVRSDPGDDLALTLTQAHDHGFTRRASSALARTPATEVTFVGFDLSCQGADAFIHQEPDLLEHPPCRFVGDAQFALELLGRDTTAGGGHEEHGVEPGPQGRGGLVEDRPGQRVDMVSALLAGVRGPFAEAVVEGDALLGRAGDAVRPPGVLEEVEAGGIGGELLLEIVDRVPFHGSSLPEAVRAVKGYLPFVIEWTEDDLQGGPDEHDMRRARSRIERARALKTP